MSGTELWNEYCEKYQIDKSIPHGEFSFGDDADELSKLVCAGIKTATSSLYDAYAADPNEPVPQAGDISVILNSAGQAVCIIRDTRVYTAAFGSVTKEHAYKEGEGDQSLEYWRRVHRDFFTSEAGDYGLNFTPDSLIVCEEFEVVYKAEN